MVKKKKFCTNGGVDGFDVYFLASKIIHPTSESIKDLDSRFTFTIEDKMQRQFKAVGLLDNLTAAACFSMATTHALQCA